MAEEFDAPESVSQGVMDSVAESDTSEITVFPIRVSKVEERYGEARNVVVPEALVAFLEEHGWTDIDTEAVYWKLDEAFVSEWENEVMEALARLEEESSDAEEAPEFMLNGMLACDTPLRFAVQIKTGCGELWFVMGEQLYLLRK